MNKKQFLGLVLTLTVLSLAWVLLTPLWFTQAQVDTSQTAPHRGFFAPPFTLKTPQDEVHSLDEYRGNPVLVFFWASWCSVCKSVMPNLETVYQEYAPQGFEILAVNTTNQDVLSMAETYFEAQGYTFTMLFDQAGETANQYQMRAVPTSVLIDPEGKVVDVIIGSGISEGYLRAQLESLLIKDVD